MNNNQARRLVPKYQKLKDEFDPSHVRLNYNEFSDTLYLYLFPGDQPLVSVPESDSLTALLVDPESEEVHGLQIDDFLERAVVERPNLLEIALLAGIDPERVDHARQRIGDTRLREAVISSTIEELFGSSDVLRP